jgi:formate dehydrogenase subunit delta
MSTDEGGGESAKLVRMANQIADYFRAYPEDAAREGVRAHLKSFWTPRMLRDLQAHADAPGMHKLVHDVLPLLN